MKRDIEQWAKDIGAFTWKELAEAYQLERPAVREALGKGFLEGWLEIPWTSQHAMQVWYRHAGTKWTTAGKLRDKSRMEHPDLWPNMGKNTRRRLGLNAKGEKREKKRTEKPKTHVRADKQKQDLKTLAQAMRSAGKISITDLSTDTGFGRDKITRLLGVMNEGGVVVSESRPSTGRGRPTLVWSMANPKKDD